MMTTVKHLIYVVTGLAVLVLFGKLLILAGIALMMARLVIALPGIAIEFVSKGLAIGRYARAP
jgi:5-bromo-4-chloroindolyl phosphate hydrolysis protein